MNGNGMEKKTENKFVAVKGGKLAYEVTGSGPAVLCLPSLGDTRREYERFAPALVEAGYRVLVADLRGMGQSRGQFKSHSLADLSNDIGAVLDAEGIDKAYLVGCSVSGASIGLFAIEHPERVLGLAMFGPLMHTGNRVGTALLVGSLRTPGLGRMVWNNYFKTLYPARPLDPEYFEHIKANDSQPGAMKSIADMCATPRLDDRIGQIKAPTLIYIGSKDPDFKDAQAEVGRIKAKLPQAEIHLLDGFGHYPQRECPELVIPRVIEWLAALSR
jgi:pimeloyl-ACP methyl ester carboxylesterase